MNTGVVSKRFAKALLLYSMQQGREDKVYEEVETLAQSYNEVPKLRKAVDNPVLEKDKKLALLKEAAGGKGVSDELMRFFQLVLDGKRESFLQFMAWSFIDQYRMKKNIHVGKLTMAVPAPSLVTRMEKMMGKDTGASVELATKVDPALIGGFIIELGGYRMDASVANQLERMKGEFMARNRRIV